MKSNYLQGISVSHWKGSVDWQKALKEGIVFGFAKATEANTFKDRRLQENLQGMQGRMTAGVYHFFRGNVTANEQAAHCLATLEEAQFDFDHDWLAVTISNSRSKEQRDGLTKADYTKNLNALLMRLEEKIPAERLLIYSSPNYFEENINYNDYDFARYPLWVAHYTNATQPKIPQPWGERSWCRWEYTPKGRIAAVQNGTEDVLLSRGKTNCQPPTTMLVDVRSKKINKRHLNTTAADTIRIDPRNIDHKTNSTGRKKRALASETEVLQQGAALRKQVELLQQSHLQTLPHRIAALPSGRELGVLGLLPRLLLALGVGHSLSDGSTVNTTHLLTHHPLH